MDDSLILGASEWRTAVVAAIVGGTLGVLGGLFSAWLASFFARSRDAEREAAQVKAAARLIDDELRNAHDAAVSIEGGAPYARLPTTAWVNERVRLAATFRLEDWDLVAVAYDRVNGYNWRFEANVLAGEAERRRICEKIIGAVPPARQSLCRYVA
jgi:hypothetical protein